MNSAAVLLPPNQKLSSLDFRVAAWYVTGTTCGALGTGLAVWMLSGIGGLLPEIARAGVIAIGALFVWLCEQGPLSRWVSLPQARRQIPAEVFGGGLTRGAFRFGFELGTGVRTYVPSPTPYVLLLTIALGQLTLGCALCAALGFGVGRGLPIVVRLLSTNRESVAQAVLRGATIRMAPAATTCVVLAGALSLV